MIFLFLQFQFLYFFFAWWSMVGSVFSFLFFSLRCRIVNLQLRIYDDVNGDTATTNDGCYYDIVVKKERERESAGEKKKKRKQHRKSFNHQGRRK